MRFLRPIAGALALSVAALSFTGTADARPRHHHHGGNAFAAGVAGFAAGALLSGALAQPRYYCGGYYYNGGCYSAPPPVYYEPAPVYRPAPVYYGSAEPWTPEWYAYCESRYRSFNARTGYFLGFDGQYHFCQ
jgi:hypothetical protein